MDTTPAAKLHTNTDSLRAVPLHQKVATPADTFSLGDIDSARPHAPSHPQLGRHKRARNRANEPENLAQARIRTSARHCRLCGFSIQYGLSFRLVLVQVPGRGPSRQDELVAIEDS